jgi:hypothetical protein
MKSPVPAQRHTREIRESSLISGEDGSLRGQSGGCDHEVMSTPGPTLVANDNEQVRMGLGDVNVVVDHGNGCEDVVKKRQTTDPRLALGKLNADPKVSDGDRGDGYVVVVVDGLVEFATGTFDIDEERGVEQQPCQLRSSTVTRSRTAANSARQRESTLCRRSIAFTSEPRPLKTGSIRATALPRRTMVIRSPRCSTASRRSANLRAASVGADLGHVIRLLDLQNEGAPECRPASSGRPSIQPPLGAAGIGTAPEMVEN